jgi:pantoate--beta-alanine ligase
VQTVTTPHDMQRMADAARKAGRTVGCVPTMGALHAGHLSLIHRCRADTDLTIMTLFVNPMQFDRKDDLARYPRDPDRDAQLAREAGVDAIYAPSAEAMYPKAFATSVTVDGLTDRWEGASRPGHFRGVATVCTKLFAACRPHSAYFGQKDYQQTLVVRRLAADLDLGLEIIVLPTVRETDGLALSSRNVLLSPEERRQAAVLSQALSAAAASVRAGERQAERIRTGLEEQIRTASLARIEYVAVCDSDSLEPLGVIAGRAVALVAARFGTTRLIDNALLETS